MNRVAGIDVGKARLDVSLAGGPVRPFANTAEDRPRLVEWLGEQEVTQAVCEPTGGYERELVGALQAVGLPVVLAHPTRVRAFARACGTEAKTDLLDAQVLAHYGATVPAVATPPPDPARTALRDLVSRRHQLVVTRVQEKNRRDKGLTPAGARSIRRHLAWLDREIARLAAQIQQAVAASGAIAPFAVGAARCGARCTWPPWSPCATRGSCSGFTRACGSAASRAKLPWSPWRASSCCTSTPWLTEAPPGSRSPCPPPNNP